MNGFSALLLAAAALWICTRWIRKLMEPERSPGPNHPSQWAPPQSPEMPHSQFCRTCRTRVEGDRITYDAHVLAHELEAL